MKSGKGTNKPAPPAAVTAPVKVKQRHGCLYYIGMGLLAFLALGICGAIANMFSGDTPASPAPERAVIVDVSQETPTATNTPPPTSTPAPAEPSPVAELVEATATNTPAPPTPTPAPTVTNTPAPAIFGSDLAAWRALYGEPTERFGYQVFGPWEIAPLGDQVRHIERIYDPPVPVADALAHAATLLPADAILQRTYSPAGSPETIVNLYTSASLAARLPADAWTGGEPGQFVVIHHAYPEGERRIIIAAGNNVAGGEPPTPTPAPASSSSGPSANTNANLREGPGTDYPAIGSTVAGQALEPVGRNSAGDWLQLATGAWIAAGLVDNPPADLPVTAVAAVLPGGNPTPAPEAAPTPSWRQTVNGIEFASDCPCDQGNILNCGDFGILMSAQACYLRCIDLIGFDVHDMDRDNDGSACEWDY